MKLKRVLTTAFLVLALPGAARAAAGEGAAWWDIPYPDRFDTASLSRPQGLITVKGKDFIDGEGRPFVFRGVNFADPDKLAGGGRWSRDLFEEVSAWGANTVRLPIHPVAWRQKGADWYFARIDEAVRWANELGMYLILDWHSIGNLMAQMYQHPMYETSPVETANFWRRVAHRYQGVPTLAVYELFNEPTDNYMGAGAGSLGKASWEAWREEMEDLIDLIRVYDDSAIPLVAGFNWAYDLRPVADAPIRRERVAYAAHAYSQKAKPESDDKQAWFDAWQADWGFVAETYPVIASEIGWVHEDGFNAHVPVINNDGTYGPNLVEYMDARGISWTVWNFDPDWAPTMISDWDYTPTEQGRFFKKVMQTSSPGRKGN